MRTLVVVPRYGENVLGGAETLVRALAERAFRALGSVEIATTCAVDHRTWRNELPEGTTLEQDIPIHRFAVTSADGERHAWLTRKLAEGRRLTYLEELALLSSGVWSQGIQDFLERTGESFDHLVFAPYLFGTTYWGTRVWPERSIIIPCLHDEPHAYMRSVREMLGSVAGCVFNSDAERRLAGRLSDVRASGVVGLGFDDPLPVTAGAAPDAVGSTPYLAYVGRLEEGKGVHVAINHVARYSEERRRDIRLVLVGDGPYVIPRQKRDSVIKLGYVDERTKAETIGGALALINPSMLESFSIVLMEAWLRETPVLVSAQSEVMTDHCEASGGGVAFRDYDDFAAAVDRLLAEREWGAELGRRGREYVCREYSWDAVLARLSAALTAIASAVPGPPPANANRGAA